MGSCVSNRIGFVAVTDTDGEESFQTTPPSLEEYLTDKLSSYCSKGKSRSEEALSMIVEAFITMEVKVSFVEKNYATLLYQFLFCITKGKASSNELLLASQALGLLGMIVQNEDYAQEIYKDSLPVLSLALESAVSYNKRLKILDSLAIVTFFGANNVDEIETAMRIIWKFLKSDCNKKVGATNVVAAAISAWSFLLSTIEGWRISHKYWQGASSYMSNLIEELGDDCVYVASEALALIFETDCIDKFSTDDNEHSFKQDLKDNLTEKLRCQAIKSNEGGKEQEARIGHVLKYFEAGKSLETYAKIGEEEGLILFTWCQRIQVNFMRSFLGEDGFVKHMKGNEIMQSVFEFTPRGKNATGDDIIYSPERKEMSLCFYQKEDSSMLPFVSKEKKQLLKRMTLSSNSSLNKARTRLLNKKRMLSQWNDHSED